MTQITAWLVAIALGAGLYGLVSGRPRSLADVSAMVGYSVPLGLFACALAVRMPSVFGYDALPPSLWWWPGGALLVVTALLVMTGQHRRESMATVATDADSRPWHRWIIALILILIALRAAWLYDEALLRPLFGWDGWLAWSAKAKAWLLAGQYTPFVEGSTWLRQDAGTTRTSLAPHYPELLSWLQVWLSGPTGGWRESAVNIAWPTVWLALLAGCHGQWRALRVPPFTAVIGVYILASIPLANVHAALPGYADLWLATLFVFALLSLLRWCERGERPQLWLGLALALAMPAIKLEGMVWAIALFALAFWYGLAHQGRWVRICAAAASAAVILIASWLLGLAWFDQLAVLAGSHGRGSMVDVLASTGAGLFAQDNWHLLWYVLPIIVVWRWRVLRESPSVTGVGLVLAGGLGLLLALFLGTSAGRWAESFTAINRLVLHLAPIAVTLIVLLLRAPATAPMNPPLSVRVSASSDTPR